MNALVSDNFVDFGKAAAFCNAVLDYLFIAPIERRIAHQAWMAQIMELAAEPSPEPRKQPTELPALPVPSSRRKLPQQGRKSALNPRVFYKSNAAGRRNRKSPRYRRAPSALGSQTRGRTSALCLH